MSRGQLRTGVAWPSQVKRERGDPKPIMDDDLMLKHFQITASEPNEVTVRQTKAKDLRVNDKVYKDGEWKRQFLVKGVDYQKGPVIQF